MQDTVIYGSLFIELKSCTFAAIANANAPQSHSLAAPPNT